MKKVKLRDITLNITDGKHGDCESQENSGFYFISCKDVYDGIIHYAGARQITEKDFLETHKRTMLEAGDILVTNSGTIGRMALVKDLPITNQTTFQKSVAIVKPDQKQVDPKYLYYCLLNCVQQFVNQSNGSAQKNLLLGTMRNFEMFIEEDVADQKELSAILSAYDDLIENNQKQIKLLEEAAQRLYKEWFVDLRFPNYENTKVVDGVPEGWEKKKISDIGKVITGKTPSTSKKEYYDGEIPFVTIPDMHDTIYPIHTERTLSNEGANSQKGKFISVDSIMVSCIATVGLVNIALTDCQTNQQINSVILNEKGMLYYTYCSMKRIKALLDGVGSNGATMTNVNKTKFENIEVLLPTEELQKRFYDFCAPIFRNIKNLSFSIDNAKQARDRLLPKLMNGELEV